MPMRVAGELVERLNGRGCVEESQLEHFHVLAGHKNVLESLVQLARDACEFFVFHE